MKRFPVLHTRRFRRLLVVAYFLALLLASATAFSMRGRDLVRSDVGVWGLLAFGLVGGLMSTASGFRWNQLGRKDERQRQRWIESKALAYQTVMVVLYPCVFWFVLRQIGVGTSLEVSPTGRGWLLAVGFMAFTTLPIAIAAWREPDFAED